MRVLLLFSLLALSRCAQAPGSPLAPSAVLVERGMEAPAVVRPLADTPAALACVPTLAPNFPVSRQAEKVAWLIIAHKAHLRRASTIRFQLEEADPTARSIYGTYTEDPIGRRSLGFHAVTLPGFQSVDRREIVAGVLRWSVGVNLDLRIKGVPMVECLPETFPIWLHLDLR